MKRFSRNLLWGGASLCAIAMGLGAIVMGVFKSGGSVDSYLIIISAIIAIILGLVPVALYSIRSTRQQVDSENRLIVLMEQIRAMADNIPGVLFQWCMAKDGTEGFRYCSPRSEELFGFKADEVIMDWRKIHIHPGDIERWAESLKRCSKSMEDWFFEGRFVMPGGDTKWWRGTARPVETATGDIIFYGIILDITREKDAEREIKESRRNAERLGAEILMVNQSLNETNQVLQRINTQKNEILGVAAHDLKNPLGGVVGFAGALRVCLDEEHIEPFRAEMIDITDSIEQSARHMLNIINGLLNASALEDGAVELELTDCEMDLLIGSVISMNDASARRKSIAIHLEAEAGCVVIGDLQRLQELADNILSNAIKYSPKSSQVWVKVFHSSPTTVQFSVRDEGPGLTEDDKKRLFGKFQKLSARPTDGETSTGLGLAIAKSIVELHGGRIWAESELGFGTTFFVDLPVKQDAKKE
jgi:PAS domain S-box-containing protein